MALLTVNRDTCTKCGICAGVCPGGIIFYREGSYPRLLPGTDEMCLRCGHCVAVCPSASLDHADVPLELSLPLSENLGVSFEQAAQLIRGRRSVRKFRDKDVPRGEIERIIDVARFAPTGHNNQVVRWLVINDRETMKKLAGIGTDWMRWMIQNNPVFGEMLEGVLKRQEAGQDAFLRGAPAVVVAFAEKGNPAAAGDCTIALAYFNLAANAAGLGCCWAGFFNIAAASFPPMMEAVSLPDGFTPYGSLMAGYPRYTYPRIPARKTPRVIWRP